MTPRYVVRVFDHSGTCEMNERAESSDFPTILRDVRRIAARYRDHRSFAVTLQNDDKVDLDFDGLTDSERDQFHDAVDDAKLTQEERAFAALDGIPSAPWMEIGTLTAKLRGFGHSELWAFSTARDWMRKKSKVWVEPGKKVGA